VVAQSQGDAQRFRAVLTEYQKAPQVTRDRMYTDAMQQVYTNVTKVLVDSKQGSNLLYLPLDKLMQSTGQGPTPKIGMDPTNANVPPPMTTAPADTRARETSRTR
jgi:membrane protease subunit HflK